MLVLGLLLILLAAAITVGAVYDGSEAATVELLGWSFETTIAGVFFTGVGTTLLLLLGLWLLTASMGRARRRRSDRKLQKNRQRESVAQLEQERNELRAENERLSQRSGTSERDSAGPEDATAPERESARDDESATRAEAPLGRGMSGSELETTSTGGHAAPAHESTSTMELPSEESRHRA
jgi:Na+-transporting methylmalonyl-CoA/oxaloacetate decarboxylase gamma subunit